MAKSRRNDSLVRHHRLIWGDIYSGTREALTNAGIAKAEWFPDKPIPSTKREGCFKRNFKLEENGLKVWLQNYQPSGDRWNVRIDAPEDEQERRRAAEEAPTEPETIGMVFEEGDRAILYRPEHEQHLDPVKIVEGYALHAVNYDNVPVKRWGYIVRHEGDPAVYFCPPHELREYAHKPRHLRLAVDNGR